MQELKSWGDLAKAYPLVLFNVFPELNENTTMEYIEQHHCEAMDARDHLEECTEENCKQCEEYRREYGDNPECNCEPFQWFVIGAGEFDVEYLNKEFDLDIFYSETVQNYILPVYHYGTSWDILGLNGGYVNV